jgi:hypothetical protein
MHISNDAFVAMLSDDDLMDLFRSIRNEQDRRIDLKIEKGDFPTPIAEELDAWRSGKKGDSIFSYKRRNNCGLLEAKRVFEYMVPIEQNYLK